MYKGPHGTIEKYPARKNIDSMIKVLIAGGVAFDRIAFELYGTSALGFVHSVTLGCVRTTCVGDLVTDDDRVVHMRRDVESIARLGAAVIQHLVEIGRAHV